MKLGSLFDGSGGFPLAARNVGIEPVWASEIEPFCVAVTRMNFPSMKHLGSVTKIDGAKVEPVDVITFGSPCQDMSVAGKREGLRGERSGLFFEAVRIIKEMREATHGQFPRFAVWENVLGSLSSNSGEDFGSVLNELLAIVNQDSVVRPNDGWRKAGAICGDAFSLAWRVLDARYWGVPQRRKRVFLVCDFRSQSAPAILFKTENGGLLPTQSSESGNETAPALEESADASGERNKTFCLEGNGKRPGHFGKGWNDQDVCYTLNTVERHAVAVFENHGNAGRYRREKKACQTLTEQLGTGGNNAPLVITASPSSFRLKGDVNLCATLTRKYGVDAPFVVAVSTSCKHLSNSINVAPTILANSSYSSPFVCAEDQNVVRLLTPSDCAKLQGFPSDWGKVDAIPEEQLPFWRKTFDEYCATFGIKQKSDKQILKWMRKPYSETNEYKMWGNGVALPCVEYIMRNIKDVADE